MAKPRVITAPEDSDVTLRFIKKRGGGNKKKGKQEREEKEKTEKKGGNSNVSLGDSRGHARVYALKRLWGRVRDVTA